MKKCANCGFESPDEALSCPSCSTDAFVTTSPEALGHIISPEEQRFWERMTFRQFAIFLIRLQSLWLLFYAVVEASYLTDYLIPYVRFTPHAYMIVLRAALHLVVAIFCLRYADQIVSWFVKDIIPKPPTTLDDDKPAA
jgi:RNA polymerase subunit RPABC4/transcription elongation factor Spt4